MTGYYSSNNTAMPVSSIPWDKYTHIIHFASAPELNSSGNATGRLSMYYLNQGEINQIIAARPPGKKVLVSVKVNDSNFGAFAQSVGPAFIGSFTNDIINLVNLNGYDGVDIDWEHVVDPVAYSNLLSRLRSALPGKVITMTSGDWEGLDTIAGANSSLVDQVNVMCYDMDFPGGGDCNGADCSWYNSPVTQGGDVWRRACDLRVSRVVNAGVPKSKIGVGLPFYGRRRVGVTLPETVGNFPMNILNYRDMVSDSSRWQPGYMRYDAKHKAEYLSIPGYGEFIPFTGPQTLGDYASWAKSQGFGGFMTFTIEREFLGGAAGDGKYPLSTALHNLVFGGSVPAAPTVPQVAVAPLASGGIAQTFQFQATGSTSASTVLQLSVVIDASIGRPNSCWLEYWAPSRTLFLRSDNGSSWSAAQIGAKITLGNSACSISAASATVSTTNNLLSLGFPITFNSSYAGQKSVFAFVADSAGKNSGWVNSTSFSVHQ